MNEDIIYVSQVLTILSTIQESTSGLYDALSCCIEDEDVVETLIYNMEEVINRAAFECMSQIDSPEFKALKPVC